MLNKENAGSSMANQQSVPTGRAIIRGMGHYAPVKVLTNADLESMVETSDEWITTRTGIKERHVASEGETCSELAYQASLQALEKAGMKPENLTHILLATFTADYPLPPASSVLQEKLGIKNIMAVDLSAACSGFVYALDMARAIVNLHENATVLVVASEIVTSRVDWTDRTTCVLFGDGAGAAVVTADGTKGDRDGVVLDSMLSADGSLGKLLTVCGGGSEIRYAPGDIVRKDFCVEMQGREVYKHAVRAMTAIAKSIMERNNVSIEDVNVLMPHQANLRIIEAVGERLKIPREQVYVNVDRYGNTSAASIPIALSEASNNGFIKKGDLVLVVTFGAGFTWGSALIQY